MNNSKNVEGLTFILVKTLDLNIEQGIGVDLDAELTLHKQRKALLILVLDGCPARLKLWLISVLE